MKDITKRIKKANELLAQERYYLSQQRPRKALIIIRKLEKILKKGLWDERAAASILNDKGIAYFIDGKYPQSIKVLRNSLKMKKKIGNERFAVSTMMNLAFSYRADCQYDESLAILEDVRALSKIWGDQKLAKDVDIQINNTDYAKAKRPLFQIADLRMGSEKGISVSLADIEYLPSLFNELIARVESIYVEMHNPFEAKVTVDFIFENPEEMVTDPYKDQEWKKNRPISSQPRIKGSSPNFVVFFGPEVHLAEKDIRIVDEESNIVKFDSREQCWHIFTPDSYPIGGFCNPMPACEKLMFFSGIARVLYWKLSIHTRYKLELKIRRNREEGPFQFGLFFPYKRLKIAVSSLCIERKDDFVIDRGYLKRIPYNESRTPEIYVKRFLNFAKYNGIYAFGGDEIYRLEKSEPTQLIETEDYQILGFEIFPLRQSAISKFDLFPILKHDIDFRREVGNEKYTDLVHEVRQLPEKCQPHVTSSKCRECATKIQRICIVNLIGILCDSDVLPHHGFEYSDLLIKVFNEKELVVPVIAKGPVKLTWKKDQGLLRQLLEKFRDEKVEVVVVVTSAQMGNRLRIQLEHLADIHAKSLVLLTERDLAQFLLLAKRLNAK